MEEKKIIKVMRMFMAIYKKLYRQSRVQIFDTPSIMPDKFIVLYDGEDGLIRYCRDWDYLEVLNTDKDLYKRLFAKYGM